MHAPVHDRMPTPVGTHLIRAATLVCHVGRAFILFVSTFSKKFPSVKGSQPNGLTAWCTDAKPMFFKEDFTLPSY